MLNNLKAEYVRKGLNPVQAMSTALGCSDKTARNKLDEKCPTTVTEAMKIIEKDFSGDEFSIDYLFESFKPLQDQAS